jgi:putative membrane protein insertion efficiency factor
VVLATLRRLPVRTVIFAIELYRTYVSPMRLPTCRFSPTCSQYAVEALSEYGLVRGGWLAAVRLAKCGPWHRGGWDPIPERRRRVRHADADANATAGAAEDAVWGSPASRGETKSCV